MPSKAKPARVSKAVANIYEPLVATGFVACVASEVFHVTYALPFFPIFLGLWLIQFGMVKLFDIDDFANKFTQYDVFGSRARVYAYVFPFIQIALGLAYLGVFHPQATSILLLVAALINLIGLYKQYDNVPLFKGVSLSGFLRTPLREAAIVENTLMIAMALAYLLTHKLIYG